MKTYKYKQPKKYQYKNIHLDLDSESNGTIYINQIAEDGWRLKFIVNNTSYGHPLCIFEKEQK